MAKKKKDLKLIVQNTLNSPDGYEFVKHIIEVTECMNRTVNFDINKKFYFDGRKSIGDYILELIKTFDFESFVQIYKASLDNSGME